MNNWHKVKTVYSKLRKLYEDREVQNKKIVKARVKFAKTVEALPEEEQAFYAEKIKRLKEKINKIIIKDPLI